MTTPQEPVGSGFGPAATAFEVMAGISLAGRVAVVTGGYSGLGKVTSAALAAAGASVIVPSRDRAKAEAELGRVPGISIARLDLTDPASIDAFGREILSSTQPLDLLICAAGVMATPLFRDRDGHEGQFATNHLGHYRLACTLWPALLAAEGARVVSVSSRGHQIAGIDFDDVDFESRGYDKWSAYGQSKTANALFARALDRRGAAKGVRAFSLHPGQILTGLARHLSAEEMAGFDATDEQGAPRIDPERGMKTPEQGAATILWCATSTRLNGLGGVYCEDCEVALPQAETDGTKGVAPWAMDPQAAERLWLLSEQLTGLSLGGRPG